MKTFKATVFENRIPEIYDLSADFLIAQEYHLKHGITWNITAKNIDVHGYTSILGVNQMGAQRWMIENSQNFLTLDSNADVNIFCFDEAEWSTPGGAVIYPLLPNTPTGCTYLVNNKPFVNIATYLSDHNTGLTAIEIAHEWMHCLVKMANLAGFPTQDVMDNYIENNLQDLPNSSFVQQWQLLQPWINSISPIATTLPQVTITRTNHYTKEILGQLRTNDGKFGCDSLELCYLNNQQNISAIPPGKYLCQWKFKLNSLAYHYQVMSVSNRTGIFIHAGNFFFNSEGCILLGNSPQDLNKDGSLDLINSQLMVSAFENYMQKKDFTLVIQ